MTISTQKLTKVSGEVPINGVGGGSQGASARSKSILVDANKVGPSNERSTNTPEKMDSLNKGHEYSRNGNYNV